MQLEALDYFAEIASGKTFLEVAEDHFLSQSALSKTVRKLEDEVGVELLEKAGRSVRLTPAGFQLYQDLKNIAPLMEEMQAHLSQARNQRTVTLRISMPRMAAMKTAFENFRQEYPDTLLCMDEADYMRKREHKNMGIPITPAQWDMEIVHTPLFPRKEMEDGWTEEPIFEDRVVALMSNHHPLRSRASIRLIDLNEYPIHLNAWMRVFYQKELVPQEILFDQLTDKNYTREELVWHLMGRPSLGLFYLSDLYMLNVQGISMMPVEDLPWQQVVLRTRKSSLTRPQVAECREFLLTELRENMAINPRTQFGL